MSRSGLTRSGSGYSGIPIRNNLINNAGFPILDTKELSKCLLECEFDSSEELVSRPTGTFIRRIFEQILDALIGLTPEYAASETKKLLRANNPEPYQNDGAVGSMNGVSEYSDIEESTSLMVFFRAVSMFLKNCAIHDFTLMDLMRPDAIRTQRILSGVINYIRFREARLREVEVVSRELEEQELEARDIDNKNVELANRIDKLSERLREDHVSGLGINIDLEDGQQIPPLVALNRYNSKLEQELIKLQKSQEVFKRDHSIYKETKARLIAKLEDQHFLLNESERELRKVEAYSSIDANLTKQVVDELKQHLQNSEAQLRDLEVALRNKTRTRESIQAVEDELRIVIKILQEITNDVKALDEAKLNFARQLDDLNNLNSNSKELAVKLERLKRQFQKSEEKILKLKDQAVEREKIADEKSSELQKKYEMLTKDRDVKQERADRTRKENDELTLQIQKLQRDFDVEKRNTEAAIAKLIAHVRQYMVDVSKHF